MDQGQKTLPLPPKHYFVDEAGDPTIFDRNGNVFAGQPGCSHYFILGFLDVDDPASLSSDLLALHRSLLADPYLANIPSMLERSRKTFVAFHAKDDVPEVRSEVYRLLMKHPIRFYAVVLDKAGYAKWIRNMNVKSDEFWYRPTVLYDTLVKRLFRDHLHKHDAYQVCFASRWKSDRTAALGHALQDARRRFEKRWGIAGVGHISVEVSAPSRSPVLQAVDYFLWALQRCYERREDRYIQYIWSKVRRIHDIEDRRTSFAGTYYAPGKPLSAAVLLPLQTKK